MFVLHIAPPFDGTWITYMHSVLDCACTRLKPALQVAMGNKA
jgi:hypothetical protein